MKNIVISRYSKPTKYDEQPHGSICQVKSRINNMCDIYVQLSHNESMPLWEFIGAFDINNKKDIFKSVKKLSSR